MVWIEMKPTLHHNDQSFPSPPARVVWIEIVKPDLLNQIQMSPPARVVWIEIKDQMVFSKASGVATREGGVD